MRCAGGRGALLAFGAFEKPDPVFRPTSSTLDPSTIDQSAEKSRGLMYKEIPSPRRRSQHSKDAYPLIGSSYTARSVPFPSGYSISGVTPTNTREQHVAISHASSSLNEEELGFADPLFSPPKRERETRHAPLVLRPASSGGPALQTLSLPPVKANLAVRRGVTVLSRLPLCPTKTVLSAH